MNNKEQQIRGDGVAATRYGARWDASTWAMLALVAACTVWPVFLDDGWAPVVISAAVLIGIVAMFLSIYYVIDGDRLEVHVYGTSQSYPIDKIASVRTCRSMLSAPAVSLTHRLEIRFADRSVLKSAMPLLIGPVRQQQFIAQLQAVNPDITVQLS